MATKEKRTLTEFLDDDKAGLTLMAVNALAYFLPGFEQYAIHPTAIAAGVFPALPESLDPDTHKEFRMTTQDKDGRVVFDPNAEHTKLGMGVRLVRHGFALAYASQFVYHLARLGSEGNASLPEIVIEGAAMLEFFRQRGPGFSKADMPIYTALGKEAVRKTSNKIIATKNKILGKNATIANQ